MKITTRTLTNLLYLESTAERNNVFPICDNIHLALTDVLFTWSIATGTYQVTVDVPLNEATDITPFNVCVNTTKFFSIIKSIRSDIVNIDITQQGLLISDAFIKIHLPVIDGAEFPNSHGETPTFAFTDDTTTCKGSDLNGLDKLPAFTMDFGNYMGVIIKKDSADLLDFYAISTASLYHISAKLSNDYPRDRDTNFTFCVPPQTITALGKLPIKNASLKLAGTTTGGLTIWWADASSHGFLTSRLLPLSQFDYSAFDRRTPQQVFSFQKNDLITLIKLYRTITESLNVTINVLAPNGGVVPIDIIEPNHNFVSHTTFNKISEDTGGAFSFSVDVARLLAILNAIPDTDNIIIHANDTGNIVVFKAETHVVFLAKVRRF